MNDLRPDTALHAGLRVEVIDTFDGFKSVEADWKALEAQDPETTVFLSWDWLAQAFADNPFRWSVLAVRAADGSNRLVGLLPLKYRVHWSSSRSCFQSEIEAGGRLLFSEYTGFLCDPGQEPLVMSTLAHALRTMPWSRLSLRYVAQTRRAELFCAAFERFGYAVAWKDYRINDGETDNLVCPHVTLPDDFEDYLQSSVSANTRQRYRRFKRKYFSGGEYYFTHCEADTLDRDIANLMRFWQMKWDPVKGASSSSKVAANFEQVLRAAHSADALFLPTLWRGETPLGALGHVMDPRVGAMHFIIAGRNPEADEAFIGPALHFHSIECGIYLGCQTYDFGHGDEPYKFSYGAEKVPVSYFTIIRPDEDRAMMFDPLSTGAALKRIGQFIKAGKTEQAEAACTQLAELLG
ncbi:MULTISPECIES: GNAT family N-acetyltransferase [unclassified Marinovum]